MTAFQIKSYFFPQKIKRARKTDITGEGLFEKVGLEMGPARLAEPTLEKRNGGKQP